MTPSRETASDQETAPDGETARAGGPAPGPAVGRTGIWSAELRSDDPAALPEIRDAAAELEGLGFGAVWLGGSSSVPHAATLVRATSRITVATGIQSIWDHTAQETAAHFAELEKDHPGRFLLGLGASHAQLAERYRRPYSSMREYLDALDAAPVPVPAGRRVLAALGPKMLALAASRSVGAHPYLVTAEHTAQAREVLGEGPLLAPELKVVLESDPERARAVARGTVGFYMGLPNYTASLERLGYTEDDFQDGGSDRLVDAVVAWGEPAAIRARVDALHAAGADHVALQLLQEGGRGALPRSGWRRLAEVLELDR